MREIKGRAWAKRGDEWIVAYWQARGVVDFSGLQDIEQFTGLKDVNGTEIFEGDIVRCHDIRFEVKWSSEDGGFIAGNIDTSGGAMLSSAWVERGEMSIIGNIHTTPELLA